MWRGLVLVAGCSFSAQLSPGPSDAPPGEPGMDATPDAAIDAPMACPVGYATLPNTTSRYRVVTNPQAWANAQSDCANDGTGTHLAVPDTMAEHVALADAITGATATAWIGVTDRVTEGSFRVVTGGGTTYFVDWYTGASDVQPDDRDSGNNPPGDCVEITASDSERPRRHYDEDCATGRRYICECDGVAPSGTF